MTSLSLIDLASNLEELSKRVQDLSTKKFTVNDLTSTSLVLSLMKVRSIRNSLFDRDLFADPAWDMLLSLKYAELSDHRVSVSQLCLDAKVPSTTALRWINSMTNRGLIKRRADPFDRRRYFLELSAEASKTMDDFIKCALQIFNL